MNKKNDLMKLLESITYMPQMDLLAQMFLDAKEKNIEIKKYHFNINAKDYILIENDYAKVVVGEDYNYIFLKKDMFGKTSGFFQRWGKTVDEDPQFSPIGPEILDIEISVNGCPPIGNGGNCKFCYKNNTNKPPTNMPLEVFADIIDKIPKTLTQVAFGITGVQTNPDFIPMMRYCRLNGIIPNFTLSGADLTDELADEISQVAGALAVSCYESDKNICYDTVKKFTDRNMTQVNIHIMVSKETLPFVYEVLKDRKNDPRLAKLHAIVFLGVKPKGRAKGKFNPLTKAQYKKLVKTALDNNVTFGFDSCSCHKFTSAINNIDITPEIKELMIQSSEPCESLCMSAYINTYGEMWACSFTEDESNQTNIDVTLIKDFISDVWYSDMAINFRNKSINSGRECTVFPEINK